MNTISNISESIEYVFRKSCRIIFAVEIQLLNYFSQSCPSRVRDGCRCHVARRPSRSTLCWSHSACGGSALSVPIVAHRLRWYISRDSLTRPRNTGQHSHNFAVDPLRPIFRPTHTNTRPTQACTHTCTRTHTDWVRARLSCVRHISK